MTLTGFKIPIRQFAQGVAFYREVLKFEVLFEAEEYGWATIKKGEVQLGLYVPGMGGGTRQPGGSIDFSFEIDAIEAFHAELQSTHAAVSPIVTTHDGLQVFEVTDPDGNELTFRQVC